MNLPTLSIRRHVLAWMLSGVLVLFGIISYHRIGVDRFPYIEFPMISVTTVQAGANPDVVDSSITNIIESAVNSVPGIEHVQSTSSPGVSQVNINFTLDKNIDVAFNEVQSKVNQVLRKLPKDIDPPVVAKVQTGSNPMLWLALQGDRTLQQLNVYARNVIKKKLETVNGVGEIRIGGERRRVIRVNADIGKMAAFGVTTQDIVRAFNTEHLMLPGGFLVAGKTEDMVKLDLEFHNMAALSNMVVASRSGAPVRLKDIAGLEDGQADYRQLARFNGKPTVGIGIVKIPNANTVAIANSVLQKVEDEIEPQLPPGMTLILSSNDAIFIQEMVDGLLEHLLLGTLLTAIVVWLFLKSLRATIIISMAIPVSLLGAVAVMYQAGYTFNTLTLLALLLLIGVVVDDAIVVLENIFRHREHLDPDPVSAAVNGSTQVAFAVIAASLTLVSIFAPVIFLGGIIGKFFQSFGVVVTFGVIVSLFVSLTLTPMLCSRYLSIPSQHGRAYMFLDAVFKAMDRAYRKTLALALGYRWTVVGMAVITVASSVFFFNATGKGFVPDEDEGRFMVFFRTPLGSSINYTDDRLKKVEEVIATHKEEVAGYFTVIGLGSAGQVNQGLAFVRMTPKHDRKLRQYEFIPVLSKELSQIPGVRAFAAPIPMVGGMRGEPLQFILRGLDLDEVGRLANELRARLAKVEGIGRLDLDLQLDLPQLSVDVDRVRATDMGVSAQDVGMAVNAMAGGLDIAKYNDIPGDGERYDVRLKAAEGSVTGSGDISRLYLRAKDGSLVRLDTLAKVERELGPAVIGRYDLQYSAAFFGNPSIPLGDAIAAVQKEAAAILPLGYTLKMVGQAEEFGKTMANIIFAFTLAMVLVYMVLASQFDSFIQPLIIMMAQPLAIIGGVAALWATGQTLNIYSMIGLVLLVGLVAKNSILLVDMTNQLRGEGKSIRDALTEACPVRMRPVIMTSMTIILALLPAAVGVGAGADSNAPLAIAVIGGMVSSTLLTLVVVPSVYSLVENGLERFHARRAGR
ncbi:MAG: efflux RND transporter permease subunit [Nitrospinae bacterium]|nr:efflux RND transporter permease subunit [Nitrospinota bacterium]